MGIARRYGVLSLVTGIVIGSCLLPLRHSEERTPADRSGGSSRSDSPVPGDKAKDAAAPSARVAKAGVACEDGAHYCGRVLGYELKVLAGNGFASAGVLISEMKADPDLRKEYLCMEIGKQYEHFLMVLQLWNGYTQLRPSEDASVEKKLFGGPTSGIRGHLYQMSDHCQGLHRLHSGVPTRDDVYNSLQYLMRAYSDLEERWKRLEQ